MTHAAPDEPASPSAPESAAEPGNLAKAIRRRFTPLGGEDDLTLFLQQLDREQQQPSSDQTIMETRRIFAALPADKLEALICEALAALSALPSVPDWLANSWARAKERGVDQLTLDDINAEIAAARRELAEDAGHMRHGDFRIGEAFWCSGRRWRCTDIGTRVIVAIRVDTVEVATAPPGRERTLNEAEAKAEGWFNGPPYAVAEAVFDEDAMQGCTRKPETDATQADAPLSELPDDDWFSPETAARLKAHAHALREQARAGGLRFEAYLPPRLANWLLAHVESGTFRNPSEAVFVILGEHEELEPHADLRRELLKRSLDEAMEGPFITSEELRAHLDERLNASPLPAAVWRKRP